MAFKPNYHQERSARNRNKEQKKQEKLRRQQEATARRKEGLLPEDSPPADTDSNAAKPEVE